MDSTVITTEGIDDLAAYLGCGDKVAELTAQAMQGSMPFHEALAKVRIKNTPPHLSLLSRLTCLSLSLMRSA